MGGASDLYAESIEIMAADYHRDFKHADNKDWGAEQWKDCRTPRCERFRAMVASLPESAVADAEREIDALRAVKKRIDSAIAELERGLR